jgi:hypothetical protein
MIEENSKIFVSYSIIGVFVAFVVFESLLVGLLPLSYKNNNSSCQNNAHAKSNNQLSLNESLSNDFLFENKIVKRKRLHERVDEFNLKNPHYLDKYKKTKNIIPINFDECPELVNPVPGTLILQTKYFVLFYKTNFKNNKR